MAEYVKIKENADWYYANLDSLLPKYRGRFVGIVDCGVFGAYDDCLDGVLALEKAGNPRGTFIVHKCIPLEEEKKEWSFLKLGDLMVSNRGNTRFTFRIPAEGDFTIGASLPS